MQDTIARLRRRQSVLKDREAGFTLIELLIVIVILGILAAIVVFAVQNLTGSSAAASCQSDYKTVETAAEAYNAQVGHYPAQISDLMTPTNGAGPWLKELPSNTSHYTMQFGVAPTTGQGATNGYQPGVIVVTPAGGNAQPAASASPGTAGVAAATACANVK
jgi:general secretion pathway protein G